MSKVGGEETRPRLVLPSEPAPGRAGRVSARIAVMACALGIAAAADALAQRERSGSLSAGEPDGPPPRVVQQEPQKKISRDTTVEGKTPAADRTETPKKAAAKPKAKSAAPVKPAAKPQKPKMAPKAATKARPGAKTAPAKKTKPRAAKRAPRPKPVPSKPAPTAKPPDLVPSPPGTTEPPKSKPRAKGVLGPREAEARYREGVELERSGDMRGAMTAYHEAGESGYGPAQKKLGDLYGTGNDVVERDYETALRWYDQARKQGIEIPKPFVYPGLRR